jgi:hypothetical protein
MHKINFQEFVNHIRSLNDVEREPAGNDEIRKLKFLTLFSRSKVNKDDRPFLKYNILTQNTFSIKISKSYLSNPEYFCKEECKSIYDQICNFYETKNIRLIDLAYLVIFFSSRLYEDLISSSNLLLSKKLRKLEYFEEIFYRSLDLENFLLIENFKDISDSLENVTDYNLDIHKHLIQRLNVEEIRSDNIKYMKNILNLVQEKNIFYTDVGFDEKKFRMKLDEIELKNNLEMVIQKYNLDYSYLNISNIENLINIFKNRIGMRNEARYQIEVMKDFSYFLRFPIFMESTCSDRLKIYDYIYNVIDTEVNNLHHIKKIIQTSKKLVDLFFYNEKNLFVENLEIKIAELENAHINIEKDMMNEYAYILEHKLLILKSENLFINNDSDFCRLFDYSELRSINNDKVKKYIEILDRIKIYKKYLSIFISISKNASRSEYKQFVNNFDKIFDLIKGIINLKIKYFINLKYEERLKLEVNELHKNVIEYKLLIRKFSEGKIRNPKDFLVKNIVLCENSVIVDAYLKNSLETTSFKVFISNSSDLKKIFNVLMDIYFDRTLFKFGSTIVLDRLMDTYVRIKEAIDYFEGIGKIKINLTAMSVKEVINFLKKEYKYRRLLKKDLPKFIIIKYKPRKNKKAKCKLRDYFNEHINKIQTDVLEHYKEVGVLNRISKVLYRKSIDLNIEKLKKEVINSSNQLLERSEKYINLFRSVLLNEENIFPCDNFMGFYLELKDSCKRVFKIHYINKKLSFNYTNDDINNCRNVLNNSKFVKYHLEHPRIIKKLDFILSQEHSAYATYKENLSKIKLILTCKDYFDKKLSLLDILFTFKSADLDKIYKDVLLEKDISKKLGLIKEEISNLRYFKEQDHKDLSYENRHQLIPIVSEINKILQIHLADLLSIDILAKYEDKIKGLKEDVYKLINMNETLKSIILDVLKLSNTEIYPYLIETMKTPLTEINLECLSSENIKYKHKLNEQINILKNKISELYFVSNDDIINLINGKFKYEDVLKNIFNFDRFICQDNYCIGIISKSERLFFENKIEQIQNLNNSTDFELFYNKFKIEFRLALNLYFKSKLTNSQLSKNDEIAFIDEYINEYNYFNKSDYIETNKTKFLKKHELALRDDFTKLYPKPVIDVFNDSEEIDLFVNSMHKTKYELIYYPPSNIIFTKLTNTIFNKISISLDSSAGIILYGESSTGKTETVKYYCRSVGVSVFVFCCNENIDIVLLENIITGCIINKWYLCLDEFNRLSSNVMSKLSDLILESTAKDQNFRIFLTFNIGYLGRNRIPTTLKSLFSEIRVDNPDMDDILDVYFNKDMKTIIQTLKEKSSNLQHYNFSLRAINTILYNLDKDQKNLDQSLFIYYYALFNKKDKELLKNYIQELSYIDLFEYGMQRSTGILLYGESSTGKSTLIREAIQKHNIKYEILHKYDEHYLYKLIKNNIANKLWIIFDCILESTWVENLNSVLDDNKILCMDSGEIVKIGANIKIIFETNDISRLTPATLTRVFTIYFDKKHDISEFRDHVIFLQGPMGIGKKRYFIDNILSKNLDPSSSAILTLNCRNVHTLRESLPESHLAFLYLEEYEYCSEKVSVEIKEFYEYMKIDGQKFDNLNIVISYNGNNELSKINFDRRLNCKIIKISKEDVISQIEDKKIQKLYEREYIRFDECFRITEILIQTSFTFDFVINLFLEESELCFRDFFTFCLEQKKDFIVLGPRLSGKNYLLKECSNKLKIINVFAERNNIQLSNAYVNSILTDDLEKISKDVIKSCLIYRICPIDEIVLNFEEFLNASDSLEFDSNSSILGKGFIKNVRMKKCFCCVQETYKIENAVSFPEKCDSNLISFTNIYKLYDFISTTIDIKKKHLKQSKYNKESLEKINVYNEMSKVKEQALIEDKNHLKKYELNLKKKILEIESIEREINIEKIKISQKKEAHSAFYKKIINKKELIRKTLESGETKLQESISKIQKINKKNIAELKCMNTPPKAVHFVVNIIYNMIHKANTTKTWAELLTFLRSNDILYFINNIDNTNINQKEKDLELDIEILKSKEKEIYKSSRVCFIFYEWIINNYEFKCIKEEIKPLEDEIEILDSELIGIHKNIELEEVKFDNLEKKLGELRVEYKKLNEVLENTKKEINAKNSELVTINKLISKLNEEVDKWIVPDFNLKYIYDRWCNYNKILIINCNDKKITNIPKLEKKFVVTSTKDYNFIHVLNNVYKYSNNLLINDIYEFNEDIYRLCKFQIKEKDFCLVLNADKNLFSCIGYDYKIVDEYIYNTEINVKELEDKLLNDIHEGVSIDAILESKNNLDVRREEYKKCEEVKFQLSKINEIYKNLNDKFNLSFGVFDEYLKVNGIIDKFFNINIKDIRILEKNITEYCTSLNIEDIHRYNTNILIITNTDDFIYYLESNIKFTKVISIGDKKSNELFQNLLKKKEQGIYLIKNIDLYDDIVIDNSSNKFVYVSEYMMSKNIVKDCRLIYMKYVFSYERAIELYKKIYSTHKDVEDLIILHCGIIRTLYDNSLQRKYSFSIKDLDLLIRNRKHCTFEYLKYLIYINKIDKEDADKIDADTIKVEKIDADKEDAEKEDADTIDAEKIDAEKIEVEKLDADTIKVEKIDADKEDADKIDADTIKVEKIDADKEDAEKEDAEKIDAEKIDAEKIEVEKLDADKIDADTIKVEKIDADKEDADKIDAEKIDADKEDAEKIDADTIDADTIDADTIDADTIDADTII